MGILDGRTGGFMHRQQQVFKLKLLNLEIIVTHRNLKSLNVSILSLTKDLNTFLPPHIFLEFKRRQKGKIEYHFQVIKSNNIRKFNYLKSQQLDRINVQSNWFRNTTNFNVPTDIKNFLALGPKFSIPPLQRDTSLAHLMADVDNIVSNLTPTTRNLLTAQAVNAITNHVHKIQQCNSQLHNMYRRASLFMKNHPELLLLQSDKGNVTVLMNNDQYIQLANNIIQDKLYYLPLERDPTSTIQQKANKLVLKLKKLKAIDEAFAKKLNIYKSLPPKFYG